MPPPLGALSDRRCPSDVCLTSVCLSRSSGLSREQRRIGRLKLAQRWPTSYLTRTPFSRSKGRRSTCRGGGICGGLPHSLLIVDYHAAIGDQEPVASLAYVPATVSIYSAELTICRLRRWNLGGLFQTLSVNTRRSRGQFGRALHPVCLPPVSLQRIVHGLIYALGNL